MYAIWMFNKYLEFGVSYTTAVSLLRYVYGIKLKYLRECMDEARYTGTYISYNGNLKIYYLGGK